MPDITVAGTYTKDSPGFDFLAPKRSSPVLLFAGITAAVEIQYKDDADVFRTFENGVVSTLPNSWQAQDIKREIRLVVTGTPVFNVTGG